MLILRGVALSIHNKIIKYSFSGYVNSEFEEAMLAIMRLTGYFAIV